MTHPTSDPSPPEETEDLKARIVGLEALLVDAQKEIGELKAALDRLGRDPRLAAEMKHAEALEAALRPFAAAERAGFRAVAGEHFARAAELVPPDNT